jgi:glycerate dehydrogenase
MKILLLDGYTLFQEDISRFFLRSFGEVVFHDRSSRDNLSDMPKDVDVLITNKALVGVPELEHFTALKLVIVSATGYNCVDIEACAAAGVPVCNVPAYGTFSVAQHAMAMLLHYSNHVAEHALSVRTGDWSSCEDWTYTLTRIREWHGKTLGIIGMGNIGSCFAGMTESMGINVIYHHTRDLHLPNRRFVDLDTLAKTADVISLHCPLNERTDKLINERFLSLMKPSALLINTSRGGLIDSLALREALLDHRIAAALLDVLEKEPPPADHPLIGLPNAIITPHIAWISYEARKRICDVISTIVTSFGNGEVLNRVN